MLLLAGIAMASGCVVNKPGANATTRTATDIPAETAKAEYWYAQPPAASVPSADYQKLYDECEHAIIMRYYVIDRVDYREGILTSKPMISQQIWELWRRDVGSTSEIWDSSLATYRRTIRWQITKKNDEYAATPYVLIEHYIGEGDHAAIAANIRSAVSSGEALPQVQTSRLTAAGTSRWYAIGRDEPLEKALAKGVQERLNAR